VVVPSIEAPRGPTCIFNSPSGKTVLTMTVEPRVHDLPPSQFHSVAIGGYTGDCGTLGKEMLDLYLDKYTMLNITAPCAAAEKLAALAIGRL
jgi:hypothetical protein